MAALAAAAENQGLKPKSKIAPSSARLKRALILSDSCPLPLGDGASRKQDG